MRNFEVLRSGEQVGEGVVWFDGRITVRWFRFVALSDERAFTEQHWESYARDAGLERRFVEGPIEAEVRR